MLHKLCNELIRTLEEFKNRNFGEFLSQLIDDKDTGCSLWKVSKKGIKRLKMQILRIKKEDRMWERNSMQKAQLFAEYLATIFKSLPR